MTPTDGIIARGGKFYVNVNGVERGFYSREMANQYIGRQGLKSAIANESLWTHNADLVNRQLGINTHGSASNPYYLQGAARRSYASSYENFWQTALAEQDAKVRASVTDADFTTTYRTIDGKPVNPNGTPDNGFRFYEHPGMNNAQGANASRALTPEAQQALDNARRAEQGAHFQGTSQQAMNRLHGIGQETDATKYFRELEAQQAGSARTLTPEARQALENARRAEQGAHFQRTSQQAMNRLHGIGQETDATKYFRELEKAQKTSKGADKIGKFFKGKGGKAALIIGGLALVGTAIFGLSKCSDDKKTEAPVASAEPENPTSVVEEQPAPVDETPAPVAEQPVAEQPAEPVQPEEPAYEPIVKLNDDGTYTTKKNDNFYTLAENLLKDYCAQNNIDKTITPYSPEVQILAERIMRKNEYWYDPNCTEANKRYSAPMLYPNVNLTMVDFNDLVKKAEEVKEEEKVAA